MFIIIIIISSSVDIPKGIKKKSKTLLSCCQLAINTTTATSKVFLYMTIIFSILFFSPIFYQNKKKGEREEGNEMSENLENVRVCLASEVANNRRRCYTSSAEPLSSFVL